METSRSSSQAVWPELSPSTGLCYLGLFRVIPAASVSSWPLEGPPGTDGRKLLCDRQAWSQSDVAAHLLGQVQTPLQVARTMAEGSRGLTPCGMAALISPGGPGGSG